MNRMAANVHSQVPSMKWVPSTDLIAGDPVLFNVVSSHSLYIVIYLLDLTFTILALSSRFTIISKSFSI